MATTEREVVNFRCDTCNHGQADDGTCRRCERGTMVARGRCGYEQFEPDNTDSPITMDQALEGINRIRNSIIGAQNINWSEHIYPLVSLLNRAGYEGLPYPEAKANIGIVLDRIERAEKALDAALTAMRTATEGEPGDYPLHEHHLDEIFSAAIEQAQAALGRE